MFNNIQFQFKIERKWKQDYEFDFPVTIIKNLDLNILNPSLRQPFKIKDVKPFESSTMFISLSVQTPMTGYVSGQRAQFFVTVDNQSGVYINSVQVGLLQVTHYNSENPKKKKISIHMVKSYEHTGVAQFTSRDITSLVNIPALDPSTESSCKIIEIFYEVHVAAKINGLYSSPTVKIPIIIGTKAFVEIQENGRNDNEPRPSTSRAPQSTAPRISSTYNLRGFLLILIKLIFLNFLLFLQPHLHTTRS